MSTVISNGYRLPPGISVTDFVRCLEETFTESRYVAYVKALASLIVTIEESGKKSDQRLSMLEFVTSNQVNFSRISLKAERTPFAIARDVIYQLQDSLKRRNASRVPSLDLTLSIAFLSDPHNSDDIYAMVYTDNREYIDVWESIEGINEYFYWNNSDSQLSQMTRKEWKEREAKWDELVGGIRPSTVSVSWELNLTDIYWTEVDDADLVVAIADERLQRQASLEWAQRVFGKDLSGLVGINSSNDDDNGDDESNGDDTSEMMPV